jgi:hypothetical protein
MCCRRQDFGASGVWAESGACGVLAQRIRDAPSADFAAVAAQKISPRSGVRGFNDVPRTLKRFRVTSSSTIVEASPTP